jgi:hypothetical protein
LIRHVKAIPANVQTLRGSVLRVKNSNVDERGDWSV